MGPAVVSDPVAKVRHAASATGDAMATTSKEYPMNVAVVRRGTPGYTSAMATPDDRSTDVSVRQFVADSGSVTRGLRQGRSYTLTLNGEPLARMVPIRRRRAVPKEEVLAIFATAPAIDADELREDLDDVIDQEVRDPFEGTRL
jgi:antitoxin (DNA-binding transcriptional repressor) of toxin-antitoxin stability system